MQLTENTWVQATAYTSHGLDRSGDNLQRHRFLGTQTWVNYQVLNYDYF